MKTLVIRTTVLFCFVALLIGLSKATGQLNSHTEGLTEEERLAPDPTQVEIPAEVSSNYFYSATGVCPPGFDTHTFKGEPPEVERARPLGQLPPVRCTESVETIMTREAARLKNHPPVPGERKVWSYRSGGPETASKVPPPVSPASLTPALPEGFIAGAACPPGFTEVPGGAEAYGLKPFELPEFEPIPISVCRPLSKSTK